MEQTTPIPRPDTCPYLSTLHDPDTCYAYPTSGNACSYSQPPGSPLPEHQGAYCLGAGYKGCPVIAGPPGRAFPLAYLARVRSGRWPRRRLLAVSLVLALLAFTGWWLFIIR